MADSCDCKIVTAQPVGPYSLRLVLTCSKHSRPSEPLTPAADAAARDAQNRGRTAGFNPPQFGLFDYIDMSIYVNAALPPARRKATALHELGHFLCWSIEGINGDGGEAGANWAATVLAIASLVANWFEVTP